jgi:hypothetical protein
MIEQLIDIRETDSLDDLRTRLAKAIGWPDPVPVAAFRRAVDDPAFAAALITSRNTPGFLAPLLNDPGNAAFAPKVEDEVSNARLAAQAVTALVRWGKAGFTVVDDATLARREAACIACPNLGEPTAALQKLLPARPIRDAVGQRTGSKICTSCGCQVAKKIRLPTESCPSVHPSRPDMTRWLEPVARRS